MEVGAEVVRVSSLVSRFMTKKTVQLMLQVILIIIILLEINEHKLLLFL